MPFAAVRVSLTPAGAKLEPYTPAVSTEKPWFRRGAITPVNFMTRDGKRFGIEPIRNFKQTRFPF